MTKQELLNEIEKVFKKVIRTTLVDEVNGVRSYDVEVFVVSEDAAEKKTQSFYVLNEGVENEEAAFYVSRKIHPDIQKYRILKTELEKVEYDNTTAQEAYDLIKQKMIKPGTSFKASWQSITSALGLTRASQLRQTIESLIAAPSNEVPAAFSGVLDVAAWVVLQRSLKQIDLWLKEDAGIGLNMNDPKAASEIDSLVALGLISNDDLGYIKAIGNVSFEAYHNIKVSLDDVKKIKG